MTFPMLGNEELQEYFSHPLLVKICNIIPFLCKIENALGKSLNGFDDIVRERIYGGEDEKFKRIAVV